MIGMTHYLVLSAILFALSVMGIFLNRKNICKKNSIWINV